MKKINQQAKELRKLICKQFVLRFIIYVAITLILFALFETFLSPALGNYIADTTSNWEYISSEEVDGIFDGSHRMIQQDYIIDGNFDDNMVIRFRILDTYATLKQFKDSALPIVFILGIAGLVFLSLNKFIYYFNELSANVTALYEDRTSPIILSKDLKIMQDELSAIQKESLQNEHLAQQAERRKNELITYIAHDLRTPLTSIMGYVSLLQNDSLKEEKRKEYVTIIYKQSQKLSNMIDDFFDINCFNLQKIKIKPQHIDLSTLCMQVSEDLYPSASDKQITIEVNAPIHLFCSCDPKQIARALTNIVRNAIAYAAFHTDITIEVCANKQYAEISVKNFGQTISIDNLENIFKKFFREDQARNSQCGGAGLGLAISREIIEAHKGKINVESHDFCTIFTMYLPYEV